MAKSKITTPSNLNELYSGIVETAENFGFKNGENGKIRETIFSSSDTLREPSKKKGTTTVDEKNYWFGFVREDQPDSGGYEGLSFVVFPEYSGDYCLVSIGIGSGSIGKDSDLASSPGFRRSFLRLTNTKADAKFCFKLAFDEMLTPTPGLEKAIEGRSLELVQTTEVYNIERPGLLPAAVLVNYKNEDGWNIIKAWLAQYAQWRNWSSYKKGTEKTTCKKAIGDLIKDHVVAAVCPTPCDICRKLLQKRFVVLQGAPGCGKTWSANQVARLFKDKVEFVQFHAETTYADFIYGIKPVLNGKSLAYTAEKGALLRIIDEANEELKVAAEEKRKPKKFLLIIDEFNRANLANVLGPVFLLFEQNDKDHTHEVFIGKEFVEGSEHIISYSHIPENLYVLATMNTADKSLAVVDFALRRRFAWVTLRPHTLDKTAFPAFDDEFFSKVDEIFMKYATDEELNLQPGQSYFMDGTKRVDNILYGLMPLMKEYFAEGFLLPAKEEIAQLFYDYNDHVSMYE